jgi:hypothetical protein
MYLQINHIWFIHRVIGCHIVDPFLRMHPLAPIRGRHLGVIWGRPLVVVWRRHLGVVRRRHLGVVQR